MLKAQRSIAYSVLAWAGLVCPKVLGAPFDFSGAQHLQMVLLDDRASDAARRHWPLGCAALGEALQPRKGPYGLGVFATVSCDVAPKKMVSANPSSWLATWERRGTHWRIVIYYPKRDGQDSRAEVTSFAFEYDPNFLRALVKHLDFRQLVALTLLDSLPFMGRVGNDRQWPQAAAKRRTPWRWKAESAPNDLVAFELNGLESAPYFTARQLANAKNLTQDQRAGGTDRCFAMPRWGALGAGDGEPPASALLHDKRGRGAQRARLVAKVEEAMRDLSRRRSSYVEDCTNGADSSSLALGPSTLTVSVGRSGMLGRPESRDAVPLRLSLETPVEKAINAAVALEQVRAVPLATKGGSVYERRLFSVAALRHFSLKSGRSFAFGPRFTAGSVTATTEDETSGTTLALGPNNVVAVGVELRGGTPLQVSVAQDLPIVEATLVRTEAALEWPVWSGGGGSSARQFEGIVGLRGEIAAHRHVRVRDGADSGGRALRYVNAYLVAGIRARL